MSPLMVDGVKRPDLDNRLVPLRTMAEYLEVDATTVYRWRLDGLFPAQGIRRFGRTCRFCPSVCFAALGAAKP